MGALSQSLRDAVFYGIVDTGYVSDADIPGKCRALIRAGCKIIQLRAKDCAAARRRAIADSLLPIFAQDGAAYFVINDDAELARKICRQIPNSGLHVGQDDTNPLRAREIIGENRILGLSTHSLKQASDADALCGVLDYFAVGPVYATATKPGRPAVGLELVRGVKRLAPALPWFAIGGINEKTAPAVRAAGAERIVAVSCVLIPDDTERAVENLLASFNSGSAGI